MGRYIEGFLVNIKGLQGKRLLRLLDSERRNGTIKTTEELEERLTQLAAVLEKDLTPLTSTLIDTIAIRPEAGTLTGGSKPRPAEADEEMDPSTHNAICDYMKEDTKVIYEALADLVDVQNEQEDVVKENIILWLRKQVDEIAGQLKIQEQMLAAGENYDVSQGNFFNDPSSHVHYRREDTGQVLYVDPQTGEYLGNTYDAFVDVLGGKLLCAKQSVQELAPLSARVLDATQSSRQVTIPENDISNVIDRQRGTFWHHNVLVDEPISSSGASMEFEIDLGSSAEVNSITIEPAGAKPCTISEVYYSSGASDRTALGLTYPALDRDIRLNFPAVRGKNFIFSLTQPNYQEVDTAMREVEGSLWENMTGNKAFLLEDLTPEKMDNLLYYYGDISEPLANAVSVPTSSSEAELAKGYLYDFGFDNIRFWRTTYRRKGIFVSKKISTANPIILAKLETVESAEQATINDTAYPVTSAEYSLVKVDRMADGTTITNSVPTLPYGSNDLTHERLLLREKAIVDDNVNNVAKLRLYPNTSSAITVYKNFVALTIDSDYYVKTETGAWGPTVSESSEVPGIYKIKIAEPDIAAVYTVSYTPKRTTASSGGEEYLTEDRSAWLVEGPKVRFDTSIEQGSVISSDIYLKILLRNNYSRETSTHVVDEFRLHLNTADRDRYV